MSDNLKVLVVGSVQGRFAQFFEKIQSIDAKHGKFHALLCTGDFFGPVDNHDEVAALLSGRLQVSLPTYISQGCHPLPTAVLQTFSRGGEICPNVTLLADGETFTTSQGLSLANLGGMYQADQFASSSIPYKGSNTALFTAQSINRLYTQLGQKLSNAKDAPVPVDVLLTHHWPSSISQLCEAQALPAVLKDITQVAPLNDVVSTIKPRYHFASEGATFWERPPIVWDDVSETRSTRFISLGEFPTPGVTKKQRWFYAFNVAVPRQDYMPRPKNATSDPFATTAPLFAGVSKRTLSEIQDNYIWGSVDNPSKRMRADGDSIVCRRCNQTGHMARDCPDKDKPPEGYVCRKCNEPGHFIRDCTAQSTRGRHPEGHSRGDNDGKPSEPPAPIKPDVCWFCLSSSRFAKHLVVAIGNECYVTLPKGQIHPTGPKHPPNSDWSPVPGGGHVLIVPVEHHSTLHTLPLEVKQPILQEIDRMKDALRKCYAEHGATTVSFEVARLTAKGGHAHIQVLPIPLRFQDTVAEEFMKTGLTWSNDPEQALVDAETNQSSYFRVDLPNGHKMVHVIKGYFDLQLGRTVMSRVLGLPERADWKACALSEKEDSRDVEIFKNIFKPFDPSS